MMVHNTFETMSSKHTANNVGLTKCHLIWMIHRSIMIQRLTIIRWIMRFGWLPESSLSPLLPSSKSISSLSGRKNTSSSDSGGGCNTLACQMACTCFAVFSESLKIGQVGTQMSGSSPLSWWALQWSSKQYTSSLWILDGFFHWKPSGILSSMIHEVWSFMMEPQGIIFPLSPVRKPNTLVRHYSLSSKGSLTNMCNAIFPEHRLYYLGVEVNGPGNGWQSRPPGAILADGDHCLDGLWAIFHFHQSVHRIIWMAHKNTYYQKGINEPWVSEKIESKIVSTPASFQEALSIIQDLFHIIPRQSNCFINIGSKYRDALHTGKYWGHDPHPHMQWEQDCKFHRS